MLWLLGIGWISMKHVMAYINYLRHKLKHYIPYFMRKEAYLKTYLVIINVVHNQITCDKGEKVKDDHPKKRRQVGMPKKLRRR